MIRPRSLARRLALQFLFMGDLLGAWPPEPLDAFLVEHAESPDVRDFSRRLVESVDTQREQIDGMISSAAENWDLRRIAAVERNVLRLACAELIAGYDPEKVILNEAVNLAKTFGGKASGPFVNGVLDRILRSLRADKAPRDV